MAMNLPNSDGPQEPEPTDTAPEPTAEPALTKPPKLDKPHKPHAIPKLHTKRESKALSQLKKERPRRG